MTSERNHGFGSLAVWVLLVLTLLLAPGGCSASVDKAGGTRPVAPVVLRMLNPLDGIEPQPFVDAVDRLSGGTLRIDTEHKWHTGELSAETDLVHAVQNGQAALGLAPVRVWHAMGVRSFDALIAPMVVDSLALEQRILDSDLVDTMLSGTERLGLTGIGILPGPLRRPVGVTTQFLGPRDYRGRTLAVNDSAIAVRTLGALNAQAEASVFMGQPLDGLDGMEQQLGSVEGNKYDTVPLAVTANVNLWPRPLVVFGNPRALAVLDDSQRQILRAAARSSLLPILEIDREAEELGNLCRRGNVTFLTATPSQLGELRRATGPVLVWLRGDTATGEYLDRIESIRTQVTTAGGAESSPSCDGITGPGRQVASPAERASSLDGVYVMNTSFDDVVAAGAAPDNLPLENYGAWVMVVDGYEFVDTQTNGQACTWGYGAWKVTDQTVRLLFTNGGGLAPSHAANRPGEVFAFGWSLYRDTLTLSALPGEISPEPFLAKPWHRISRTPQRERLSSQCPPPPDALAAR